MESLNLVLLTLIALGSFGTAYLYMRSGSQETSQIPTPVIGWAVATFASVIAYASIDLDAAGAGRLGGIVVFVVALALGALCGRARVTQP